MSDRPEQVPWKQRFLAPTILLPAWAQNAPDRLVYASSESGSFQMYSWDLASGRRVRMTDESVGVTEGCPTHDGRGLLWFQDDSGDEVGRWMVKPFGEPEAAARPFAPGIPDAWGTGLALGRDIAVVGTSDRDAYTVWLARPDAEPVALHRHEQFVGVGREWTISAGGLSSDGDLVCLCHAEHGDVSHLALRVVDLEGATVDEQHDEGMHLIAAAWSPAPGDRRLAIVHERTGFERPALWDPARRQLEDLPLDLEGSVDVADWWPDASALLLLQELDGRNRLHRFDLATGSCTPIEHREGTISSARVRPDGTVWMRVQNGATPPTILSGGDLLIAPDAEPAPAGRAYASFEFRNPGGDRIHGFVVEPEGQRPHPLVMEVHGGPQASWKDSSAPPSSLWSTTGTRSRW